MLRVPTVQPLPDAKQTRAALQATQQYTELLAKAIRVVLKRPRAESAARMTRMDVLRVADRAALLGTTVQADLQLPTPLNETVRHANDIFTAKMKELVDRKHPFTSERPTLIQVEAQGSLFAATTLCTGITVLSDEWEPVTGEWFLGALPMGRVGLQMHPRVPAGEWDRTPLEFFELACLGATYDARARRGSSYLACNLLRYCRVRSGGGGSGTSTAPAGTAATPGAAAAGASSATTAGSAAAESTAPPSTPAPGGGAPASGAPAVVAAPVNVVPDASLALVHAMLVELEPVLSAHRMESRESVLHNLWSRLVACMWPACNMFGCEVLHIDESAFECRGLGEPPRLDASTMLVMCACVASVCGLRSLVYHTRAPKSVRQGVLLFEAARADNWSVERVTEMLCDVPMLPAWPTSTALGGDAGDDGDDDTQGGAVAAAAAAGANAGAAAARAEASSMRARTAPIRTPVPAAAVATLGAGDAPASGGSGPAVSFAQSRPERRTSWHNLSVDVPGRPGTATDVMSVATDGASLSSPSDMLADKGMRQHVRLDEYVDALQVFRERVAEDVAAPEPYATPIAVLLQLASDVVRTPVASLVSRQRRVDPPGSPYRRSQSQTSALHQRANMGSPALAFGPGAQPMPRPDTSPATQRAVGQLLRSMPMAARQQYATLVDVADRRILLGRDAIDGSVDLALGFVSPSPSPTLAASAAPGAAAFAAAMSAGASPGFSPSYASSPSSLPQAGAMTRSVTSSAVKRWPHKQPRRASLGASPSANMSLAAMLAPAAPVAAAHQSFSGTTPPRQQTIMEVTGPLLASTSTTRALLASAGQSPQHARARPAPAATTPAAIVSRATPSPQQQPQPQPQQQQQQQQQQQPSSRTSEQAAVEQQQGATTDAAPAGTPAPAATDALPHGSASRTEIVQPFTPLLDTGAIDGRTTRPGSVSSGWTRHLNQPPPPSSPTGSAGPAAWHDVLRSRATPQFASRFSSGGTPAAGPVDQVLLPRTLAGRRAASAPHLHEEQQQQQQQQSLQGVSAAGSPATRLARKTSQFLEVTGARNDRPVQHLIRVQANGAQLRVTSLTPFGERVPLVETAGAAAGRAGAMRQTYYPPLESIAALGARSVASRGWDSTAGKFDFHWDNSDAVIPAPTEAAPGPRAGSMNAAVQCELDPDEALSSTRKDVQAAAAAAAANGRSELAVSKVRYFAVPNSSVAAISQGTDTSGLASVSRPQSRARATDERRSNSPAYVRARASQWQP